MLACKLVPRHSAFLPLTPITIMTDAHLLKLITRARSNVYQVSGPTPLEHYPLPCGGTLLLKREDISPIHAYKWRGAFNFMASQPKEVLARGVVTASAGNHAQGVALAAARLGVQARITMPTSVARMKAREVARLGGEYVDIVITGDTFDEARQAANEHAEAHGMLYVPPYDHELIMAGQGTIGDELLMGAQWPDVVFLQIGGGGLAAGVAALLKNHAPHIHIIGVEGVDQACMAAAVAAGEPVTLPHVDVFCDGTAVKRAGEQTFGICRRHIDSFMTVTNDDVCAAVQKIWEMARTVPEPSGAMGMAAWMKRQEEWQGKNVAVILSGANMDFTRLSWIAGRADIGATHKRCYEIEIPECCGSMLELLTCISGLNLNIEDFLYGKTHSQRALPVFSFKGTKRDLDGLERVLHEHGYTFRNVTQREDVTFRIVTCDTELFHDPFLAMVEFAERPGALLEFMEDVAKWSNICYFNYAHRGELVGRALMGFEFENAEARQAFLGYLRTEGPRYEELGLDVLRG